MKNSILISIMLLLTLTAVTAQMKGNHPPMPAPEDEVELFDKELELSQSQEKVFLEVLSQFSEDLEDMMDGSQRPDPEKMKTLMDERNSRLEGCLMDDQKEAFSKITQQIMQQGGPQGERS